VQQLLITLSMCLLVTTGWSQSSSSDYQVGSIVAVQPHLGEEADASITRYDVSVRVGDKVYTVLYSEPANPYTEVKYRAGINVLVYIDKNTLTYNDLLGRSKTVPILSWKPAAKVCKAP